MANSQKNRKIAAKIAGINVNLPVKSSGFKKRFAKVLAFLGITGTGIAAIFSAKENNENEQRNILAIEDTTEPGKDVVKNDIEETTTEEIETTSKEIETITEEIETTSKEIETQVVVDNITEQVTINYEKEPETEKLDGIYIPEANGDAVNSVIINEELELNTSVNEQSDKKNNEEKIEKETKKNSNKNKNDKEASNKNNKNNKDKVEETKEQVTKKIENINNKYDMVIKGEKEEQVNKIEVVTDEKGEAEKIINVDENVTIAVEEPEQTIIVHEYEAKNPFEEELKKTVKSEEEITVEVDEKGELETKKLIEEIDNYYENR